MGRQLEKGMWEEGKESTMEVRAKDQKGGMAGRGSKRTVVIPAGDKQTEGAYPTQVCTLGGECRPASIWL
jgi:hypothetical protein